MSFGSRLFAFTQVVRTSVSAGRSLVANLLGIVGEESSGEPIYGGLGVVHRPLPPDAEAHAEAVALRVGDSLVPLSWRDVRLDAVAAEFGEGDTGLVGYGGGSCRMGLTDGPSGDRRATVFTLRIPYSFSNGTATKEHVLRIDPTPGSESISVVHGNGHRVELGTDSVVLENGASKAEVSASKFRVDAPLIELQAPRVALGSAVDAAANLIPQSASTSVAFTP